MNSTAKLLAAALMGLFAFSAAATAQDAADDEGLPFGTRYSVGLDKKIIKGLHVELEEEARLVDGVSTLDKLYTTAAVSYKVCPYLKVGAGYSAISARRMNEDVMTWDWRHRGFADITGMIKEGGWKFSLRERFQATYRTREVSVWEKPQTALALKSRFKASYMFKRSGLEPYASIEHRLMLNGAKWDELSTDEANFRKSEYIGLKDVYTNRLRSQFGLKWEISKKNAVEIYGLYDNITSKNIDSKKSKPQLKLPVTTEHSNFAAIGIGYTFSF